jgi:predicted transcriptional regulator of viral defense system
MKFLEYPYYVGLLSAAMLHGASHQAVQALQIVIPNAERPVRRGRLHIQFFRFAAMRVAVTTQEKTWTGFIPVSSPEWTGLDLVRFSKYVGGLDAVLTVVTELAEKMSPDRLREAAGREPEKAHVQRLGWLLDRAGFHDLTAATAEWMAAQRPHRAILDRYAPVRTGKRDMKWQVLVNAEPESEV